MAIKSAMLTKSGIEVFDAYHRVEQMKFQGKDVIQFYVRSYKDKDSQFPIEEADFGCAYDLNGANPFQQAYEFLKTQPAFKSSINC